MLNLRDLEQLALDRQPEMTGQSLRLSLLRQATNADEELAGGSPSGSSVRSHVGLLLARMGLRLSSVAHPQQRAGTPQCVCVPGND